MVSFEPSFVVTVSDTTAPSLACPADVAFEATGPAGAAATWADASASDAVTVPTTAIAIGYLLPDDGAAVRGSTFALGATTVRATATDEAGNRAVCPFTVRVADTTPPQLTCPSIDPVEATTYLGSPVTFAAAASDVVDPSPAVAYSRAPGSFFVRSASVVLKPGESLSPEELIAWANDRMPYFAVPRYVEFMDALPKTPTERVQKYLLKQAGVTTNTWDREKAGVQISR